MTLLTKQALLKRHAFQIEKLDLGNDEFVYVREMSGRDRDRWESSLLKLSIGPKGEQKVEQNLDDFRAKLAVCAVCDEKGNNLLNPNDFEQLSQNMSAARLIKIADVAQRLNKITMKEQEQIAKNSKPGRKDSSISD